MGREDLVRGLIGVLCLGAAVLVLLIVTGSEFDDTAGRAILTAVALAFFSLTAVAGTNLAERRPELWAPGRLATGVSAIALIAVAVAIWSGDLGEEHWQLPASLTILAFGLGHASVLLAGARQTDSRGVRALRGFTLGALAVLVALFLAEIASSSETVGVRPIGVLAVAYALGTILMPLQRRLASHPPSTNRGAAPDPPRPALRLVWTGTAESAAEHLRERGFEVEVGADVGRSREGIPIELDPPGDF